MIVRTCDVLSRVESSTIRASLVRAWAGIRCGHHKVAAQPVNPGRIVPLVSYPRRFRAQPRGTSATDRARAPTEIDPRPDGWPQLHRVAHIRLVGEGCEHNAARCTTPVLRGYRWASPGKSGGCRVCSIWRGEERYPVFQETRLDCSCCCC